MGMEVAAVEADDAGRFLAAVLQGVEAERGYGGGIGHVPDAEHAAFVVELVVVGCGEVKAMPALSYSRQAICPTARPCGVALQQGLRRGLAARRRRIEPRA